MPKCRQKTFRNWCFGGLLCTFEEGHGPPGLREAFLHDLADADFEEQ